MAYSMFATSTDVYRTENQKTPQHFIGKEEFDIFNRFEFVCGKFDRVFYLDLRQLLIWLSIVEYTDITEDDEVSSRQNALCWNGQVTSSCPISLKSFLVYNWVSPSHQQKS